MVEEASHRRRAADVSHFIERNRIKGPPDLLPADAQGKRRVQRDPGREVRARLGVTLAERRRHVQRPRVVAPAEIEGDPVARGPGLITRVDVEFRCATDLAQVADAVGSEGVDQGAAHEVGVGELEHRADREARRLREWELQGGRDEVLLRLHLVEVLRARSRGFIAEAVEPQHVDPRGAEVKPHDGGRYDATELTRELGAVGLGGRRIPRAHSHVGVVRQAPEVVPGPVGARSHEQADVRRIVDPRQGHPVRAPIARPPERRRIARRLVVVAAVHGRPRSPHEAVVPTVVVELRPADPRGVHQLVIPATADHAEQRSRS